MVTRTFKPIFKITVYLLAFVLILPLIPMALDFEPTENTVPMQELEGPLEPNDKLDHVEYLFKDKLRGPESLPVYKGSIYTGTEGGEIYKITGDKVTLIAKLGKKCEGLWEEEVCGRPLGMRFNKDGRLFVIDAYYGLYAINVETGSVEHLLPSSTEIEGKKIVFGDDIDIDDDGSVYISEASNKWPLKKIVYTVMEHENTGRVLKFDPKTRKATVLMKGLRLPNGVQISHDKKSLLVCELSMNRILRYHLKGPKRGKTEVFVDKLPGWPDNIRPSKRGGYWVAFATGRSPNDTSVIDYLIPLPFIRKATIRFVYLVGTALKTASRVYPMPAINDWAAQFENGWVLYETLPQYGLVVELDADGRILRSFHSPKHKIHMLSEVLEHDGYLYLGSYRNPFLGRIKL
uniref:Putative conserved secreted protein n=1 Tax=Hyalomma excavatum TaxID=257692 RepID=A0A131XIP1_9ACAR